jgi:ubiquinone/menaquinone biosynthesis C-methylase UbiE
MSSASPDSMAAFRAFEHGAWESSVSAYHQYFGPLTSMAIEPLLAGVKAGPGKRILDVATGPGYVAFAAQRCGCRVDAIDFSEEMIATARGKGADGIVFEVGDAENLTYDDATFDAVVMNFGVLHLSRPEQAFSEARRVLRKDGAFGFTVWRPPEEAHGFALMLRAIQTSGDPHVPLPPGPPFFRFSDPEECRRTLIESGFERIETQTLPLTWIVPSSEALYDAFYAGTARTGGQLRAQTAAAAEAIRQTVIRESSQYRAADGALRIPMPALVVIAS